MEEKLFTAIAYFWFYLKVGIFLLWMFIMFAKKGSVFLWKTFY